MKSDELKYHVLVDQQPKGPFSAEELRRQMAGGSIQASTPACLVGETTWRTVGELLTRAKASPPPLPTSRLKPILAVAGLLLGGLVALLTAIPANYSANGPGVEITITLIGSAMVFVFCLSGAIFAALELDTPGRRSMAVALMAGNLLILLSCLGWYTYKMPKWKERLLASTPSSLRYETNPVKPASEALKPGKHFRADERARFKEMWNRELTAVLQQRYPQATPWRADAEKLLTLWSKQFPAALLKRPEEEMFELSAAIVKEGCDDPLVLAFCARSQYELAASISLAEAARDKLKDSPYSPRLELMLQIYLAKKYAMSLEPGKELKANMAAEAAWTKLVREKTDDTQAAWLLDYAELGEANGWFEQRGESLCQALDQERQFPGWARDTLWGRYWVDAAWKARGNGYADTVTQLGWKLFHERIGTATERFQSAWQANPADPRAATSMIKMVMASSDNSAVEMRFWFERAVAAQFDYLPAYDAFLWGLRPRWGGSHEAMLAFGQQCLASSRYDTEVPFRYMSVLSGIMSDNDGDTTIMQNPIVYRDMQTMVAGYLQATNSPYAPQYIRSYAVFTDYFAFKYPEARSKLAENGYVLDTDANNYFRQNIHELPRQICVLASPARYSYEAFSKTRDAGQLDQADNHLQKAVLQAAGDERALDYLSHLQVALEMEQKLSTSNWMPFMPGEDFKGWEILSGDWKVNPDGSLEVKAGKQGMLIRSLAHVGRSFQVQGEVEFVSSETGDFQAGVVFGQPDMDRYDWTSFRIKNTKKEGRVAYFSRHFTIPPKSYQVDVKGTNTFYIKVIGRQVSARVNGEFVGPEWTTLENGFNPVEAAMVGLGGYSDQNDFVVRFRKVKVISLESRR